jgi:hypothetical protein
MGAHFDASGPQVVAHCRVAASEHASLASLAELVYAGRAPWSAPILALRRSISLADV